MKKSEKSEKSERKVGSDDIDVIEGLVPTTVVKDISQCYDLLEKIGLTINKENKK